MYHTLHKENMMMRVAMTTEKKVPKAKGRKKKGPRMTTKKRTRVKYGPG